MELSFITWNVDPVALSLGSVQIRWYGICWAVGFLLGYLLMSRVYKHEKMPEWAMDSLLIYMLVSTVVLVQVWLASQLRYMLIVSVVPSEGKPLSATSGLKISVSTPGKKMKKRPITKE